MVKTPGMYPGDVGSNPALGIIFRPLRLILPSLVIAQHLDFATQLVLSNCFELLECCKSASLVLEWQNCPETRCIINECDPILIMMPGASWEWAMHIRVNQGKGLIGAELGNPGDISMTLFACKTWFTNGIHVAFRFHCNPCHKLSREQFIDIPLVKMTEATVPQ